MKLKYNHNGETNEIPLSTDKPTGKRLAVRHDNQTYYAPLVPTSDSAASDIHLVFGGNTLALSLGEQTDLIFNDRETAVTVLSNYGDFGVIADTSQPEGYNVTLTNGTEYYSNLVSITAAQPNSTIVGNQKPNKIIITGGSDNFVVSGLGNDTIYFDSSDAVIADFRNAKSVDASNVNLANSTTQTQETNRYAYDRFNTGSYQTGTNVIKVAGTLEGVYCDKENTSKKIATYDAAVVYTDSTDTLRVILLKNISNNATSTSSTPSKRTFQTIKYDVTSFHIGDDNNKTYYSSSEINNTYLKDWADFPVLLSPALINLYAIYDSSGYTNSQESLGTATQVLPDWIPQ